MDKEKWNEICFLLSDNIKTDINENDFEQNVIQALRVLEWKEFLGYIQIRPSFQIGASNRIMPDFITIFYLTLVPALGLGILRKFSGNLILPVIGHNVMNTLNIFIRMR